MMKVRWFEPNLAHYRPLMCGIMERETGIEPATSSLGSWRSTAELLPLRLG